MSVTLPLTLFIDTETAPSHDPAVRAAIEAKHAVDLDSIKAAANLKDPEKIAADIAKRRADAIEKAASDVEHDYGRTNVDGATAHLSAIAFALNDRLITVGGNQAFRAYPDRFAELNDVLEGERDLLRNTFRLIEDDIEDARVEAARSSLEKRGIERTNASIENEMRRFGRIPVVVAHSADFDVRMIWQCCVVLGVEFPDWWPIDFNKYRTDQVIDTMSLWAGAGNRVSLDKLCRALGIAGKGDIDGAGVWAALRAGRYDEVVDYCGDDVERLRQVYQRLRRPEPKTFMMTMGDIIGQNLGVSADEVERDALFAAAEAAADAQHGVGGEAA